MLFAGDCSLERRVANAQKKMSEVDLPDLKHSSRNQRHDFYRLQKKSNSREFYSFTMA